MGKYIIFIASFCIFSCSKYYSIPERIEKKYISYIKNVSDSINKQELRDKWFYFRNTQNIDSVYCYKYKNQFFKDQNIKPNFKGSIIIEDLRINNGSLSSCYSYYSYNDSVYYYNNGKIFNKKNFEKQITIKFLNDLEYTTSDTLTKSNMSMKLYNSTVMIIKDAKIQKFFDYQNDYYFYLRKGQKKYRPIIMENEILDSLRFKEKKWN